MEGDKDKRGNFEGKEARRKRRKEASHEEEGHCGEKASREWVIGFTSF